MTRQFKIAFPDFPEADMPAIPETFVDISWHNDTSPSFEHAQGYRLFVDYANDAAREFPGGKRFTLYPLNEAGEQGAELVETDDWSEMLAALADRDLT
ncbi:MAG TPA: hypothetical protein VK630_13245 [Reyranella sp.]|nr:hypothetical protein [Reyranella sp.]